VDDPEPYLKRLMDMIEKISGTVLFFRFNVCYLENKGSGAKGRGKMSKIFMISAGVVLSMCLLYDSRRNRSRKAKLEAIARAPLPRLPLSFGWNWWGIVLFMVAPLAILALLFLIGSSVRASLPVAAPVFFAFIAAAYYVYGYLRFALGGPSFILTADGITFAGNYLPWQDVLAIDYVPSGRTPSIRFRQTDSQVSGFSMFDQFYGMTSVSAFFIADPDSLVAWSRRLKEEFRKH
jgi:hypothetical protein